VKLYHITRSGPVFLRHTVYLTPASSTVLSRKRLSHLI